ncbi:hypothetical protein ABZ063_47325, partial [Streptomyces sp. NPDC006333]
MTKRIADILDEFGAGHARPMAAAFLVNTVGPWLRAQASEPVKQDMLAAASQRHQGLHRGLAAPGPAEAGAQPGLV